MSENNDPFVERRAPKPEHWTLKKEVQISQIVTVIMISVTALLYVTKMDQRLAIIEQHVIAQEKKDSSQDKAVGEGWARMDRRLDNMDSKLDRLIERGSPK